MDEGIPAKAFASGQGRWLGVQAEGEPERPRTSLVSVPYALRAVDAEALGGLLASAYALASARKRTWKIAWLRGRRTPASPASLRKILPAAALPATSQCGRAVQILQIPGCTRAPREAWASAPSRPLASSK
jgi:hypothetical protein